MLYAVTYINRYGERRHCCVVNSMDEAMMVFRELVDKHWSEPSITAYAVADEEDDE